MATIPWPLPTYRYILMIQLWKNTFAFFSNFMEGNAKLTKAYSGYCDTAVTYSDIQNEKALKHLAKIKAEAE